MDVDQIKNQYFTDGYVLAKNFFDKGKLNQVLQEAKGVFCIGMKRVLGRDISPDIPQEEFDTHMFDLFQADTEFFINIGKQVQHLVSLWRIGVDTELVKFLESIGLEKPNISVRPSMFFNSKYLDKVGHYWKLGSHQDWRSSQGSVDSVTVWFPYVDCDVSLGALEIIPGSHLQGLLPCQEMDYYGQIKDDLVNEELFIPIEMNAGDLLCFNSFLIHRSGTNSTKKVRWSSQLRFNNLHDESFIERKMPNPYLYKPMSDLVSPEFTGEEELKKYFNQK